MKLGGVMAVAAVTVAVAATGWARAAGRQPEVPPTAPSPTQATAPAGPIDTTVPGPGGLTVRYLDEDGEISELDVKDFPR